MFVTPHLQSLSPVLISSQSCIYRCSRHFTETPSSSEEFLFHKSCVFAFPPPCFLCTERIGVLWYEGIVKHAGFLHFGCLQLCKNDAGVSGTAFPFVSFMILNPLPPLLRDRQRTGDAVCRAEAE